MDLHNLQTGISIDHFPGILASNHSPSSGHDQLQSDLVVLLLKNTLTKAGSEQVCPSRGITKPCWTAALQDLLWPVRDCVTPGHLWPPWETVGQWDGEQLSD